MGFLNDKNITYITNSLGGEDVKAAHVLLCTIIAAMEGPRCSGLQPIPVSHPESMPVGGGNTPITLLGNAIKI